MRRLFLALILTSLTSAAASAQGLVWSLPADGSWVRYEGEYEQTEVQDSTGKDPVVSTWTRRLEIKSVGTVDADFNGTQTACRWVEFKLIDGKTKDAELVPGPAGEVIYKVLIPESSVNGTVTDEANIHVSFLPIVKGYRRIGQSQPEVLNSRVLQVYPALTLLMHYRELTSEGMEDPGSPEANSAEKLAAETTLENKFDRIVNTATLWRSNDVPFGLAKWQVTQVREEKPPASPRTDFKKITEVRVTMTAQQSGNGALSDLPDQN